MKATMASGRLYAASAENDLRKSRAISFPAVSLFKRGRRFPSIEVTHLGA
jgi:hypothetical protein